MYSSLLPSFLRYVSSNIGGLFPVLSAILLTVQTRVKEEVTQWHTLCLPSLLLPNTHELLSPKSLASVQFPRLENTTIVQNLTVYQARTVHLLNTHQISQQEIAFQKKSFILLGWEISVLPMFNIKKVQMSYFSNILLTSYFKIFFQ